jgi:hypothetical protein
MSEDQKRFTITLDSFDIGQLLDGLRIRAESWRKTAEFIESEYADETFVCEECNNADEASRIAQHYERVIAEIEGQIDEQGGW